MAGHPVGENLNQSPPVLITQQSVLVARLAGNIKPFSFGEDVCNITYFEIRMCNLILTLFNVNNSPWERTVDFGQKKNSLMNAMEVMYFCNINRYYSGTNHFLVRNKHFHLVSKSRFDLSMRPSVDSN